MRTSIISTSTAGRFGRDVRHVLLACAVLAFIFAVGFSIGTWSGMLDSVSPPATAPAAPGRPAELSTGRIVFSTTDGKLCRQMLIDNDTWRVTDNGTVDCSAIETPSQPQQPVSGANRFLGLRSGFR